jgi:hypothetical protein
MMKKQLFTLLFAVSASIIGITSCSKKADGPGGGSAGSLKEKLVGSYRITQIELITDDEPTDILAGWNDCDKDNLFVLKADNTSAVVDAGEQCDPPSDDTGVWEVKNNTTVSLNGQLFKILSMDGGNLRMTSTYIEDGEEQTLNVAYQKQ